MLSAHERVLSQPELLENVLARLTMRDLLLAQRVCCLFRDIIISSPLLQACLYFKGDAQSDTPYKEFVYNPLLSEDFFGFFRSHFTPYDIIPVRIEPGAGWEDLDRVRESGQGKSNGCHTFLNMPWTKEEPKRAAFVRSQASWRRMLIAQPPIARLEILCVSWRGAYSSRSFRYLSTDPGVMMGSLYDLVWERVMASTPRSTRRRFGFLHYPKQVIAQDFQQSSDKLAVSTCQPLLGISSFKKCVPQRVPEGFDAWSLQCKSEAFEHPRTHSSQELLERQLKKWGGEAVPSSR